MSPSDACGEGQPFLKSVHTTLQHFVRADWVDDKGAPGEKSGQDALTHRFDDVKNRLDKPGPPIVACSRYFEAQLIFYFVADICMRSRS